MLLLTLSYLAGVLTIISPCILPVLPFVFARAGQPFMRSGLPLLLGMAVTFAGVATLAGVGGSWAVQANSLGRAVALLILGLFGLILGGGLVLFKRPLLKPIFGAAFSLTDEGWWKLTVRWAVFFFVLAGVNEVMWRFFSTDTWIASKMLLSFPLTLVFAFLQVPLLRRHWDGEENPFAAKD